MLDREFELDVERLSQERGDNTSFFAFADTVVARSYRGTNECHGWMGIKFQSRANDEPSQIVMHVRMLDEEASGQQESLGIVGVNLCYGAFFLSHVPEELIESLLDKLTTGRIEIDMLEFRGIEFRNVDNRLMALKLVQLGLSGAAMFGPDRSVLQPSEVFHRKGKTDILVWDRSGTNLFIAECKIWKGEAYLLDGLTQLLTRYVNWRDEKTALIVFNRDIKDFTGVIRTATTALSNHALCRQPGRQRTDCSWSYLFHHPNDSARTIRLELILLNFV